MSSSWLFLFLFLHLAILAQWLFITRFYQLLSVQQVPMGRYEGVPWGYLAIHLIPYAALTQT